MPKKDTAKAIQASRASHDEKVRLTAMHQLGKSLESKDSPLEKTLRQTLALAKSDRVRETVKLDLAEIEASKITNTGETDRVLTGLGVTTGYIIRLGISKYINQTLYHINHKADKNSTPEIKTELIKHSA